ncbi:hypothetical protein ACFQ3N_13845 [Virgibacillus byunsanensis]|uniref:Spore coat protein YutH n=1 Tax=Virgibacillus byunsanensis TaxID=570945 RepID=A0ABW3LM95_9BACI
MNLLSTYYAIPDGERMILDEMEGIKTDEYLYFTISANNKEIIHMEQAALAYYLAENNYKQVAIPIPNVHGEWFTKYQDKKYLVLQVQSIQDRPHISHGKLLANFHHTGANYSYEPNEISSYGQWKELWIDKITIFENQIGQEAKNNSNRYCELLMDILPYLIGISENAIQYVQESEHETRYHETDQSTITFQRYQSNCLKPVIWTGDLMYDHPTRDLAEYIRVKLLYGDQRSMDEVSLFLKEYQTIRSLSVFSWRLLYARLVFPIHLFDVIGKGFLSVNHDQSYERLTDVIKNQVVYEDRLDKFFQYAGVDNESLHIPVLHWLGK